MILFLSFYFSNSFRYCAGSDCTSRRDGVGATNCYNDGRCQCVIEAAQSSTSNVKITDTSCSLNRLGSTGSACLGDNPATSQPPTVSKWSVVMDSFIVHIIGSLKLHGMYIVQTYSLSQHHHLQRVTSYEFHTISLVVSSSRISLLKAMPSIANLIFSLLTIWIIHLITLRSQRPSQLMIHPLVLRYLLLASQRRYV